MSLLIPISGGGGVACWQRVRPTPRALEGPPGLFISPTKAFSVRLWRANLAHRCFYICYCQWRVRATGYDYIISNCRIANFWQYRWRLSRKCRSADIRGIHPIMMGVSGQGSCLSTDLLIFYGIEYRVIVCHNLNGNLIMHNSSTMWGSFISWDDQLSLHVRWRSTRGSTGSPNQTSVTSDMFPKTYTDVISG